MASLYFSQQFDAEIYSFEPVPESYEVLRANFDKFYIKGRTFPVAISDDDSPAEIVYYPHLPGHSGFYSDPDTELAAVKSIIEADRAPVDAEKIASSITWVKSLIEEDLHLTDTENIDTEKLALSMSRFETRKCMRWTLSQAIKRSGVEQVDLLKIDVEGSELDVLKGIGEHGWHKIGQIVAEIHDVGNRIESACSILSEHGFSAVEVDLQGPHSGSIVATRDDA